MGRNRSVSDTTKLDEERVELRVRLHILEQRGGQQKEIGALQEQIALIDRKIAALRAAERRR